MSNKLEATFHGSPDFGPNLVECDQCDGAAMSRAALDQHKRIEHGAVLDDTLPIRQPQDVLTHWDDYWTGRARQVREAPPWVAARRRAPLVIPEEFRPHWTGGTEGAPPPPPPPPPPPTGPRPAWYQRPGPMGLVIGTVVWLAFFGMLALVLALGRL